LPLTQDLLNFKYALVSLGSSFNFRTECRKKATDGYPNDCVTLYRLHVVRHPLMLLLMHLIHLAEAVGR